MSEKKFKQVCKCEDCGSGAEMMITCTLEEDLPQQAVPAVVIAPFEGQSQLLSVSSYLKIAFRSAGSIPEEGSHRCC